MGAILKVFVPMDVESGQRFTNQWAKGSKFFYSNYRKKWWKGLSFIIRTAPPGYDNKRMITGEIIRVMHPRQRHMDQVNFMHGCKPLPDFLKKAGWIKDDSPKWWHCEYKQITRKEADVLNLKPGTIIIINQ